MSKTEVTTDFLPYLMPKIYQNRATCDKKITKMKGDVFYGTVVTNAIIFMTSH